MAEILHQLIGSSSQYLKGFSTIPGGFLAGFLVAIFPVFYDDILGPRDFYDFQYPVVSQTHSPVTSHHKQRPLLPGLPGLGCLLLAPPPTKHHDRRHRTLASNGPPPTAPPEDLQGIDLLGEVLHLFGHLKVPFGWSFWRLLSVDGNQKSGGSPVEGNGSLSYY